MTMMRCPTGAVAGDKGIDNTKRCDHLCAVTMKTDADKPDRTVLVLNCPTHKEVEMSPARWAAEAGIPWSPPVAAVKKP